MLLLASVLFSGCGDEQRRPAPEPGGTLTMLSSSDVDFLDPGRTYFTAGAQVAVATQRTLYRFAPSSLLHMVPDLAAAQPTIGDGGRTVTVRLRRGIHYSPPVDREVVAKDVAYAFARFFSVNVAGPYAQYFSDLVGVPSAPTKGVKPIRGIETPDDHTIVFRLRTPTASAFVARLVLPITAPVPEEYARRFDAKSPSTYNTHVVATGPYMVKADKDGNTVGYRAGKEIVLVRNPNWRRAGDGRPALLDGVRIKTDADDRTIASRQVLNGSHMALDSIPPPAILKLVYQRYRGQAARLSVGGYRFVPLNTSLKPFDDLNVRRAVLAGFDREAARKARGGVVTGPLATHFLPPGIRGFAEAGGERGPNLPFLSASKPGGDPQLAAEYMKRAGYPSGRYTGDEQYLVVSGNSPGEVGIGEVVKAQLEHLGFRIKLRSVPDDALFTNWCSVPERKVLSCAGIAWLKDYPDPAPMLDPVFDGAAISPTGNNTNYSQLDDPRINAAMRRAKALSGEARIAAWGRIDRMILETAAAIPLQWDVATLIRSKDVAGVTNAYFNSWDFAYTALK
jgi:peptide/nickel transport system substrate-binding protein